MRVKVATMTSMKRSIICVRRLRWWVILITRRLCRGRRIWIGRMRRLRRMRRLSLTLHRMFISRWGSFYWICRKMRKYLSIERSQVSRVCKRWKNHPTSHTLIQFYRPTAPPPLINRKWVRKTRSSTTVNLRAYLPAIPVWSRTETTVSTWWWRLLWPRK